MLTEASTAPKDGRPGIESADVRVEWVVRRVLPWLAGIPALALVCGMVFTVRWLPPSGAGAPLGQAAPDFPTRDPQMWINSSPLSISDLRGQAVLIDVWTYG